MKINKKLKRELIEWTVMLSIIAVLFTTGLGTQVASFLQRGLLATGIITPDIVDEKSAKTADYNFRLADEKGQILDFAEFKGKTVFINFWATWCPPCIAEMPDINDLYGNLSDEEDIVFILISVDKKPQKALDFVHQKAYDFPIYFLESRLPEVYDAHSIPTTYVISPNGKIVSERHGMAKYNSAKFRDFLTSL
ncbi:MAG: TlpA disulfide reductase family protein [Bacteroidota bacterium]